MLNKAQTASRVVKAVHGAKTVTPDPEFVAGLANFLSKKQDRDRLHQLYAQFQASDDEFNTLMRRVMFRAMARRCGDGLTVAPNVGFKHLETFEFGSAVFIGAGSYLQGRFDGTCIIGDHVWIGPQSYFDARDLVIEDYVGWGPGAKVLGSTHTGLPVDVPIIQSDLEIKPVRIGAGADVGTGAVILPGVSVGKGAIVGAGAVVNRDVDDFAVVAGVPAHFLHWREGYEPK